MTALLSVRQEMPAHIGFLIKAAMAGLGIFLFAVVFAGRLYETMPTISVGFGAMGLIAFGAAFMLPRFLKQSLESIGLDFTEKDIIVLYGRQGQTRLGYADITAVRHFQTPQQSAENFASLIFDVAGSGNSILLQNISLSKVTPEQIKELVARQSQAL